jgi:hypothetical protein
VKTTALATCAPRTSVNRAAQQRPRSRTPEITSLGLLIECAFEDVEGDGIELVAEQGAELEADEGFARGLVIIDQAEEGLGTDKNGARLSVYREHVANLRLLELAEDTGQILV